MHGATSITVSSQKKLVQTVISELLSKNKVLVTFSEQKFFSVHKTLYVYIVLTFLVVMMMIDGAVPTKVMLLWRCYGGCCYKLCWCFEKLKGGRICKEKTHTHTI